MSKAVSDRVAKERARKRWSKRSQRLGYRVRPENIPHPGAYCEVCDQAFGDKGPVFDHNHATLRFRGWLCSNCNRALGLLGDSPRRLASALNYLMTRGHYGD